MSNCPTLITMTPQVLMSGSSQAVLPARHLLHAGYVLGVVALLAGCEVLGAPSSLVGGSLVDGVHLDVALT